MPETNVKAETEQGIQDDKAHHRNSMVRDLMLVASTVMAVLAICVGMTLMWADPPSGFEWNMGVAMIVVLLLPLPLVVYIYYKTKNSTLMDIACLTYKQLLGCTLFDLGVMIMAGVLLGVYIT